MAVLFPTLQFFDENGNPLVAGKIYTYITGTNTPKSTWTTAAESANLSNPVILDDEGRAEIWLSTDSEYRIVIKTSTDDTVQGPIDNVTGVGIQLSSFSELASDLDVNGYSIISSSNGDINFTPNGSGDVNTTTTTGSINLDSTTGDINIKTTSGAINIGHKATGPGSIRFLEDTDNGSNYSELVAASSLGSNITLSLPSSTGTIALTTEPDVEFVGSTTTGEITGILSTYNGKSVKCLRLIINSLISGSNATFKLQIGHGGTPTYEEGVDFSIKNTGAALTASTGSTVYSLSGGNTITAGEDFGLIVDILPKQDTGGVTSTHRISHKGIYENGGSSFSIQGDGYCTYASGNTVSGLKIVASAGTVTTVASLYAFVG